MIGELPQSLEVCGKLIKINADFRNVLTIFEAFGDPALTNEEKAFICIKRLYCESIRYSEANEALRKAYWFCDGGDMPKSEPESAKMVDWKQDSQIIFPAVSRVLSVADVRALPFLHWWSFLSSFGEIGEGLFSTVVNIRRKRSSGKKLEKYEKEFLLKNKNLVNIHTAEEQAEFEETKAVLRSLGIE